MKMHTRRFLLMVALAGTLSASCSTSHVTPTVAVAEAPPAPPVESIGMAPGINYVWVRGYYTYNGSRYVWVPGNWQLRPRPNAIWVPGTWDQTDKGWVWIPGRWM
jgi:hypothetical protein